MKKYLSLFLMLIFAVMVSAENEDSTKMVTQQVTIKVPSVGAVKITQKEEKDLKEKKTPKPIVAYSDNSIKAELEAVEDSFVTVTDEEEDFQSSDYVSKRIEDAFLKMLDKGGGIMIVIGLVLCLCLVLLFLFAPLILIILVIRSLVKISNNRTRIAEKALENGQAIPDSLSPVDRQSDEYLRRRGIRNLALGFGLMVMFLFWDSTTLAGIGALVAFYGGGQLYLSYEPYGIKKKKDEQNDTPEQEQ